MAESKAEFLRRMALRRSRFLVSMILSESFCRVDQHLQVFRIQVFRQRIQLVYKLRVVDFRREELLQRNTEILTNVEQLRHRSPEEREARVVYGLAAAVSPVGCGKRAGDG